MNGGRERNGDAGRDRDEDRGQQRQPCEYVISGCTKHFKFYI